ncbi:hypothetical protein E3N88_21164 [Mikania micrantha]|uniref:MULE transposase domain-containing protein n=1 Tax=Mikania micrantha TaxID=192012 RepID=A0A5N6NJ29_9ASTR|nr:hypothetical protein E3N88_21164 [Mikania micrantha]
MSFWDVNFFFGDDKIEQDSVGRSYYGDSKPQELPDLNEEPNFQAYNANRIPDLNEDPCVEPFYSYENKQEFGWESQPSYKHEANEVYSETQNSGHDYYDGGHHGKVVWNTDKEFMSHDELVAWVKSRAVDNGYIVVTARSKKKGDVVKKVWLVCDRGGEHKAVATCRRSGSKKIGCPFKLVGVYNEKRLVWQLEVRNDEHNHEAAQHLEGHPFVRRLSQDEQKMVAQLTEQHMDPRNILSTIKKQNPDNVSVIRDIYNAQQKIKNEKKVGTTPMQVLENLLHSKGYVYYTREDPATNAVEEVFFCHPKSYTYWRAFPHVLMIDATYKTNMYRIPFVQIVGVTSTHHTFCIAHAFITKEREDNYLWVIQKLKEMLDKCMEPRVIITDRDLALMNACKLVFPDPIMSSGSDAEGDLAEHPILQFPEGSTAFGRCAKFHTMRIGRQKAIDWDVLTEIGERERAERWIREETPWRRLFEMAFQPSYREVVVEFLSTFTFRPGGVPEVVFSMLRQRHEMSLAEFTVITGLYWEPETVTPLYTAGITEIDDATLRAWWPHIADDPFRGTKARAKNYGLEHSKYGPYAKKIRTGLYSLIIQRPNS